jgi:hypothetical protein
MEIMSFAENGVCTEPSDSLKSDGFVEGDAVALDELNWLLRDLYRKSGSSLTSLRESVMNGDAAAVLAPLGCVGREIPTAQTQSVNSVLIVCDGPRVFLETAAQEVSALNSDTHEVLWSTDVDGAVHCLACAEGVLVVGHPASSGVQMTLLDAETGDILAVFTDTNNTTALAAGNGWVWRGDQDGVISAHSATDLAYFPAGEIDVSDGVQSLAFRGGLLVIGSANFDSKGLRLVDVSDPESPSMLWEVDTADATRRWVGFVGDYVCALEQGGGNTVSLWPIARTATAPTVPLMSATVSLASGVQPCIGDFGVAYIYSGARKVDIFNTKLERVSLTHTYEFGGVAYGGNCLHAIKVDDIPIVVSSTTRIAHTHTPCHVVVLDGQIRSM